MSKPFDPEEFDKHDSVGKRVAILYWMSIDPNISISPGKTRYSADLAFVSPLRNERGNIEPEVKEFWDYEGPFRDEIIRIPTRKEKYFGSNCYFMIINALGTDAFIIHESMLRKCDRLTLNVNGKSLEI